MDEPKTYLKEETNETLKGIIPLKIQTNYSKTYLVVATKDNDIKEITNVNNIINLKISRLGKISQKEQLDIVF